MFLGRVKDEEVTSPDLVDQSQNVDHRVDSSVLRQKHICVTESYSYIRQTDIGPVFYMQTYCTCQKHSC